MADPAWGWRPLGMADPGDGGPWGWRTLGMADSGDGEPWGWRPLGIADRNRSRFMLVPVISNACCASGLSVARAPELLNTCPHFIEALLFLPFQRINWSQTSLFYFGSMNVVPDTAKLFKVETWHVCGATSTVIAITTLQK
jgi:hypothetical protein